MMTTVTSDRVQALAEQLVSEQPRLTGAEARMLAATILGEQDGGASPARRAVADAELGPRCLALAVDAGIVGVLWLIVGGLLMIATGENPAFPFPAVLPTVGILYLLIGWARFGCTPGMYAADLRLVTADGTGRPGVARAAGRLTALLVTCLPLGVGLLSVGLTSDHRSWYDRIAGTRMVSATDDLAA